MISAAAVSHISHFGPARSLALPGHGYSLRPGPRPVPPGPARLAVRRGGRLSTSRLLPCRGPRQGSSSG
eukprot:759805-Hanusia_phi.AAC.1